MEYAEIARASSWESIVALVILLGAVVGLYAHIRGLNKENKDKAVESAVNITNIGNSIDNNTKAIAECTSELKRVLGRLEVHGSEIADIKAWQMAHSVKHQAIDSKLDRYFDIVDRIETARGAT